MAECVRNLCVRLRWLLVAMRDNSGKDRIQSFTRLRSNSEKQSENCSFDARCAGVFIPLWPESACAHILHTRMSARQPLR